jgi:hypothetical protein
VCLLFARFVCLFRFNLFLVCSSVAQFSSLFSAVVAFPCLFVIVFGASVASLPVSYQSDHHHFNKALFTHSALSKDEGEQSTEIVQKVGLRLASLVLCSLSLADISDLCHSLPSMAALASAPRPVYP